MGSTACLLLQRQQLLAPMLVLCAVLALAQGAPQGAPQGACSTTNGEAYGGAEVCAIVACDAGYEPVPGADGTLDVSGGARCKRCAVGTFKSSETLAPCQACANAPYMALYLRGGETGPVCAYECAPGSAGAACISVYMLCSIALVTLALPALAGCWIYINRLERIERKRR